MNLLLHAIIALLSFVFLGTLVPSLVSAADSTMVIVGFGLGAVFAGLMLYSVYQIIKAVLESDEDNRK